MNDKSKIVFEKIGDSCAYFFLLSIYLLCAAVLIRFFETLLLTYYAHDFGSYFLWDMQGLFGDVVLFLKKICIVFPVFLLVDYFFEKTTRMTFRILFTIMLFVSLICVIFFSISGYFLDSVIFLYSIKEIGGILKSSTGAPFWSYIALITIPALFFIISKKSFKAPRFFLYFFVAAMAFSLFFPSDIFKGKANDTSFYVKKNKEFYFWDSVFSKRKNSSIGKENSCEKIAIVFQKYFPQYQFKDSLYPFLHTADYQDVLSPFFNLKETPPNFIFIVVEGMGQDVASPKLNMMPFLDSLLHVSLSWKQCYSTADRTYGVFPALFGALPLGRRGFMSMCPNALEYETLLKILSKNGYHNNFLYSGWAEFDNMSEFMLENDAKMVIDQWDEDIEKESIGVTWGKEDHLMYRQALRSIDFSKKPRVDIFLTLSSHDPWEHPNVENYRKMFDEKVRSNRNLSEDDIKRITTETQRKMYASFQYVDDALRQLMEGYKKSPDYENSIFIITGDHSAFSIQLRGNINNHVPFIIWSPMLKKPHSLSGVATHRDVTPTILSMLKQKYNMETPTEVSWLNSSIDTATTLNANTFTPFYSSDRNFVGVMYHDFILRDGILSQFKKAGENPVEIENKEMQEQLEQLIALHTALDQYICENDALIKNEKTLLLNPTQIVLDVSDIISENSYFSKKSALKIVTDAPKNATAALQFTSDDLYIDLINYEVDRSDLNAFRVEVTFRVYIEKKNEETPKPIFVIRDMQKASGNLYVPEELKYECDSHWYTYRFAHTFKKSILNFDKEDQLKMYIYNSEKTSGFIDDIKVKVLTDWH